MKAHFIDFDDSFSFNIIQELSLLGIKTNVIHWKDFEDLPQDGILILGPGPGHPDDYQRIFPLIERWIIDKRSLFGICLGHQIFWQLQGANVIRSKEPLHGQRVELTLSKSWQEWLKLPEKVFVQRYNSLGIPEEFGRSHPEFQNLIFNDEIFATRGPRLLTYQFHPESVGTSFRQEFMRPVLGLVV